MAEGDQVPAFDSAALIAQIQKTVTDGLATVPAAVRQTVNDMAQAGAQQQANAATAQAQAQDPILSAVYPALKPFLENATLSGLAGQDAAVFYATNPQAAAHADEIEKRFSQSVAQNRPMRRQDLYFHLKGERFDQFVEADNAARKAAEERAALASTVGGGSPRTLQQEPSDFHALAANGESLNEYLADKSF